MTDPDAESSSPPGRLQGLLRSGVSHLKSGNAAAAVNPLRNAVCIAPDNFHARMALAAALLRQRNAEAALEEFRAAHRISPASADAHHGMGLALHALGDLPAALIAFRRAVTEDPLAHRSWGSIADISQDESERINAVQGVADALMAQLASAGDGRALIEPCVRALLDARRPAEAAWLLRNRQGSAASPSRHLAQVLYELGDFPGAFEQARLAFLADPPKPAQTAAKFSPGAALEALSGIVAILEAAGLRPFLAAGTLLGMYRSGAPLPYDRDVDIGLLRTPDGPDVCAVLQAHARVFLPRRARRGDRYVQVWMGGIGIDIFLHDAHEDALLCGLGSVPGDIQWRFSAFEPVPLPTGGRSWQVPAQTERYLAESYGPGWHRPDPHFASVLSSPALHQVDAAVRGCYAIWRAEKALRANDPAKSTALLTQSPLTRDLVGWRLQLPSLDG